MKKKKNITRNQVIQLLDKVSKSIDDLHEARMEARRKYPELFKKQDLK